jgi:hypothetical protein
MPSYPQPMRTQRQFALGAYQAAARAQRIRRVRHTLGLTASPVEQTVVKGVTAGVAMIPVVGPFLAPLVGMVANLFTSAHAAAVAKEGSTLNSATPVFIETVNQIMAALNAGQATPAAAISALQQTQTAYYSQVSSIIKKGGSCASNCVIGPPTPGRNVTTSPFCCNSSGTCNAACCIGCSIIEPTVTALTAIIQAGGGSYTINSTQTNGAIAGTPQVTVTYNGAAGAGGIAGAAQSLLGGTVAGFPTWILLAGGGLLLFVLMRR